MKSFKTQYIPLLLLILSIGSNYGANGQQKSWMLEQIQEMAKINYPQIKQYELIEQSREYNVSNAGKAYLPAFDVTMIGGVIDGFPSFSSSPGGDSGSSDPAVNLITVVQLRQTIWDGGITKAQKEIANTKAKIETTEVDVSLHALNQKVSDLYFGLLLINEQIKQLQLLKENLETNQKRVLAAINNGIAYQSDIDELNVQLIDTDQNIIAFEYTNAAYTKMLSAMIGQQIQSTDSLIKPSPALFDPTIINRKELTVFEQQRNLISSLSKMDKSTLYPKLGVLGFGTFIQPGLDFGPSTMNNIFVGGVSLSWNVSGLYKNKNNKLLRELDLSKIETQQETFLYNTRLQASQTQQQMEKYQALLERDQQLIDLKKSIKKSYEAKYDNGIVTMTDLLTKINDENVALQTKAVHEIQYLMTLYSLKLETGN